MPDTFISITRQ